MVQAVKTFLAVVVLTLLIWFYADQAGTRSEDYVVWLSLRPPGSAQWRFADPNSERARVRITLSGTTGALGDVREDLDKNTLRFTYVIEADPPSGPYRVGLLEKLDSFEEVRRRGLTVRNVDPPAVTVLIDRFVTKELPVVARADTFKIVQTTTVAPPTVQVTMPESQIDKLEQTEIIANIEALEAHRALIREHLMSSESKPGEGIGLQDVPLVRPPGAILDYERVFVRAVIEQREQSKLLRSVYVRFDVSADQWRGYDLEVKDNADLALEVKVRGPSDLIASLTPQDVRAYVEIKTGDAIRTEGWLTRTVNFVLPPGTTLDQTAPQIQFRLVEDRKTTSG